MTSPVKEYKFCPQDLASKSCTEAVHVCSEVRRLGSNFSCIYKFLAPACAEHICVAMCL